MKFREQATQVAFVGVAEGLSPAGALVRHGLAWRLKAQATATKPAAAG